MNQRVILFTCLLTAGLGAYAQQPPSTRLDAKPLTASDSAEGLRQFLSNAITAARSGDETTLAAFVKKTEIPDYERWFDQVFGSSDGANLTAAYRDHRKTDEESFLRILKVVIQSEGEVIVERVEDVPEPEGGRVHRALRESLKQPVIFCSASWRRRLGPSRYSNYSLDFFTPIDGAFRRLPLPLVYELGAAKTMALRMRIRQGGKVAAERLVHKVPPTYPLDAVRNKLQGVVRLNAIIAKNGTIAELRVVSGDSLLAEAAAQAVRQWRYSPTLLNGWPVEVETTIDVIFSLNR